MRFTVKAWAPSFWLFDPLGRRRLSTHGLQLPLLLDALQAALQKINLQRLLPDLALQWRQAAVILAPLAQTRKDIAGPLAEFAAPAMQHVGVDFKSSRNLGD